MKYQLYTWQEECLLKWEENQHRGIVNVVTGGGKTYLAMAAIEKLLSKYPNLQIKIVVPTIALALQWGKSLEEYLNLVRLDYGFKFGNHNSNIERQYTIYVINTARRKMSLDILRSNNPLLLICDECHHYGSTENARIFEFMEIFKQQYFSLGLSATPSCNNLDTVLIPKLGPLIYHYYFERAKEDKIINESIVFLVGLYLLDDENIDYNNLTREITKLRTIIMKEHNLKFDSEFLKQLTRLAQAEDSLAIILLSLYQKRKNIIKLANNRIPCVIKLIEELKGNPKIIIFGERIEVANELYQILNEKYYNQVAIYHSKVEPNMRKYVLSQFRGKDIRILITCRALDEGLDIPDTDVGIILSSSSIARQKVQRFGRILRRSKADKISRLYYLFIKNSQEEEEILQDMLSIIGSSTPIVNLQYDKQHFTNQIFLHLAKKALLTVKNNNIAKNQFKELRKQIISGIVNHDWLMSEEYLNNKINESRDNDQKNYYIAMLYLVKNKDK